MLNQLQLKRAGVSLREDLREFVTFGRGFAHGKPIPLTTTRHADYPVSAPSGSQAHDEPPTYVPPSPYAPPASYEPPTQETKVDYPLPSHESHESGEHLEDDRSDSRNDSEDET
jgi:hypothetical protein